MYLIDTVALSELRKPVPNHNVAGWFVSVALQDIYISVLTVFEIEFGIEQKRRTDPVYADALTGWLNTTLTSYSDRVLPFTATAARRWGRLSAQIGYKGLDLAIAAIALENGLTVVTRNISHFVPTGVATVDPFQPVPSRP